MKKFLALALVFSATVALADTLELKNGSTIIGTYVGGTDTQISFRVGSSVQQYNIVDIASIKFDRASAPAPAAPPQPAPPPRQGFAQRPADTAVTATSRNRVTVPTGTRILVRTIDEVDSARNQVGDKFSASLEEALYVDSLLIAPKGATVYGRLEESKTSGQFSGRSQLRLALTGLVINGQVVPLSTGDYELSGSSRGASTAKKTVGGAAVGAVIGAIAGGGKGAAIGAGVGAGAGTAVQIMTKGEQVKVPSETLLEFALDQPVTVPVSQ